MRVLAFDTTMAACSVAVWRDGTCEGVFHTDLMHGHAEALLPAIEGTLADAGQGYDTVDRIAVTTGPGSFTGVRVGLATARSLGLAIGCPVIGLLTTEVLAEDVRHARPDHPIVAVIDARRAEVYVQRFDASGVALDKPSCVLPDAVEALLAQQPAFTQPWCFVGDGIERVTPHFTAKYDTLDVTSPNALVLAALAAQRPIPAHPPQPVYVRPPDAVKPRAGGRLRP